MTAYEVNFDGLIGNTHNYGGLSQGNLASTDNAMNVSHPRQAARQGLKKMKYLHDLGLKQGIFLPQERPHMPTLRRLGFSGTDNIIIAKVFKDAPELLAMCYSASSMWAANAATVSPSGDTQDKRIHFTPANLTSMAHRSIEPPITGAMLRCIFNNEKYFSHHDAIAGGACFGDEGAANHNRFCEQYADQGVELFVYGRRDLAANKHQYTNQYTTRFPARQSFEASTAIARTHQLNPDKVVLVQQSSKVIDAGGFHNDVVSVANRNVLFMHEQAFVNKEQMFDQLKQAYGENPLHLIQVPESAVSLQDAVKSYLFNSQLISLPDDDAMALILPEESRENDNVMAYLNDLLAQDTPIKQLQFVNVRQSMQNGGGPACLRLRVVLTQQELSQVHQSFMFSDKLFERLNTWVDKHYREQLSPADLLDPQLLNETRTALDELTQIVGIGAFYDFQCE